MNRNRRAPQSPATKDDDDNVAAAHRNVAPRGTGAEASDKLPTMRTRRLTVEDEEAPNTVEEGFPSGDAGETSSGSSDGTEDSDPTIPAVQRLDNGTCAWWKRRSKPFKTGVILGASLILVAVVVGESVGVTKRLSTPVSAMGSTEAPAVTQEPGATPSPNPDPT